MLWAITILLAAICIALTRHIFRHRRLLRELDDAVRSERRLLPEDSAETLQKIGALHLVDSLNALIDSHNQASAQKTGYSSQVEAMLGAVQEVVIVFDKDRTVQYANLAAERLLRAVGNLQGLRLDGVLRSLTLLELLEQAEKVERPDPTQISIEQQGDTLWFEASCAQVKGLEGEGDSSTLLVLHDITKLKELEVMRREFVANVSHELRTPLTIIKGFAETLIDDAETIKPEARQRFLDKILNNAERLQVLVEDLLTISRLESRPEQIEVLEQPLKPLFEEVLDNYRSRFDSDKQSMRIDFEDSIDLVIFDRYRMHQVLDNLIENAFRYAPDFTELILEAKMDAKNEEICCAVIDDGPGIPEKDLPQIFERFYRVDKGRSRERGGTGLGLSIIKHIVQQHGGRVAAESKLGKGTRMIFTLPIGESAES